MVAKDRFADEVMYIGHLIHLFISFMITVIYSVVIMVLWLLIYGLVSSLDYIIITHGINNYVIFYRSLLLSTQG